jgi:hypothetical protein
MRDLDPGDKMLTASLPANHVGAPAIDLSKIYSEYGEPCDIVIVGVPAGKGPIIQEILMEGVRRGGGKVFDERTGP